MGRAIRLLALAAGLGLAHGPALSGDAVPQDESRLAAARKLLEVTGAAKQFEGTVPAVLAQTQQLLEQRSPQQKKLIAEVMKDIGAKYDGRRSELLNQVAALYAKTLSAGDLEAIAQFFGDGPGKRYSEAVPALMQGSLAIGQQWGKQIGDEIRKEAEAEIKKRGGAGTRKDAPAEAASKEPKAKSKKSAQQP
jgi:hypothetical protein